MYLVDYEELVTSKLQGKIGYSPLVKQIITM
jgi:hypothetical protein